MRMIGIDGFALVTQQLEALVRFYTALGFSAGTRLDIGAEEMGTLCLSGRGQRLPLQLGPSVIYLDRFDVAGRPYPAETNAADLVFQHFALVTTDIDAAWANALAAGASPISDGMPVTLPASAGGISAIKFRDPEGHPLEFLSFPRGASQKWQGEGLLGVDHTALSVSDVAASIAYYTAHGVVVKQRSLNQGPTQMTLDGLCDVVVDVVALQPVVGTSHIELLGYRQPPGRSHVPLQANDVAATRVIWAAAGNAVDRDPDGHLHQFRRSDRSPTNIGSRR